MEERESLDPSILQSFSSFSLSFRQGRQSSPTLVPPSQQKLHKYTVSAGTELSKTLLGPGSELQKERIWVGTVKLVGGGSSYFSLLLPI